MIMRFIISVFLYWFIFSASFINANPIPEKPESPNVLTFEKLELTSLANTQGLLSTIVGGHVSAITGDFVEGQSDIVLPGPEPLSLNRSYAFHNYEEYYIHHPKQPDSHPNLLLVSLIDHVFKDWQVHPAKNEMSIYLVRSKDGNRTNKHVGLYAHIPYSGSRLLFRNDSVSDTLALEDACAMAFCHVPGITNCGRGEISAKTNLKNLKCKVNLSQRSLDLVCGAGTERHFIGQYKGLFRDKYNPPLVESWSMALCSEKKANGNLTQYGPQRMEVSNTDRTSIYSWITWNNPTKINNEFVQTFTTSDNRKITYTYISHVPKKRNYLATQPKFFYLKSVNRPDQPNEAYEYETLPSNSDYLRLVRKHRPDNRFLELEYYNEGDSIPGMPGVKIERESPLVNRVKSLKAPVGIDKKPITVYRFIYSVNYHLSNHIPRILGGTTTIYDAYDRKINYNYDSEQHVTQISKYLKSDPINPYATEHYVWGNFEAKKKQKQKFNQTQFQAPIASKVDISLDDDTPLEWQQHECNVNGTSRTLIPQSYVNSDNLVGKYLKDGLGNVLVGRFFDYDKKGNILVDTLYGNLTGTTQTYLQLDKIEAPIPHTAESYKKKFTYSDNGLNLLLSETEDNGKKILYFYKPETDLLIAKITKAHENICFREFYEYDQNTALIQTIKDNGCTLDKDNLLGVSERLVTYLFPKTEGTAIGLPKRIDEMYCDCDSVNHEEKLLKRIFCAYTKEGWLAQQDHYDANGSYCYSLAWQYDDHGNVVLEQNALGHKIHRKYDANDNLIYEKGPRLDYETHYIYDYANRLVKTIEKHENGNEFVTSYQYDYMGNKVASVDRFGHQTTYVYDDFNRLVKAIYPPVCNGSGHLIQPQESIEYDFANRPIRVKDAKGAFTTTSYNSRGQPIYINYADGTEEKFQYSTDGNLIRSIAKNKAITTYERDCFGRILSETVYSHLNKQFSKKSFTYYGTKMTSSTDEEGVTTYYHYDGAGRLNAVLCEDYHKVIEYDALSRIAKVTEWFGPQTQDCRVQAYEYDLLGNVIEERIEDASGFILTQTNYAYDECGNRTHIKQYREKEVATTQTFYNAEDQPIRVIDAENNETNIEYCYTHKNAYQQYVLQQRITDPKGIKTIKTFDPLGRLVSVAKYNLMGVVIAHEELTYDAVGNLVQRVDHVLIDGLPVKQITTKWFYNAMHQETCVIEAFDTPEQKKTYSFYNAFGQKEKIVKPDGVQILHNYDALGRLSHFLASDSSFDYKYSYDKRHNITEVNDLKHNLKTLRVFDRRGRLSIETLGNELTLSYQYDSLDRPTSVILPDLSGIEYVYDPAFLKEVHRIKNAKRIYSHYYQNRDLSGNVLQSQLIGHAGKAKFEFDLIGRPTTIQTAKWSQNLKNGYDSVGNLLHFKTQDLLGETSFNFTYDDLNHLRSEQGHIHHTYQVDSISNRTQKNEETYAINHLNQLTSTSDQEFIYDPNGNLIEKRRGLDITRYTYDALNRLVSVLDKGQLTEYIYDAFNRRLIKQSDGAKQRFIYQGQDEIGSVNDANQITELRLLGEGLQADIGAAVAMELKGENFTPIHCHSGHVVCLLKASSQEIIETYRYTVFGEEQIFDCDGNLIKEAISVNPWRYASKRKDPETGWIYFGARYYDPETGRWTTPDPAGFADGSNLYAYLHHRPLMFYDAYGLEAEEIKESTQKLVDPLGKNDEFKEGNSLSNNFQDCAACFASEFQTMITDPLSGLNNMRKRHFNNLCEITKRICCGEFKELGQTLKDEYNRSSGGEILRTIGRETGSVLAAIIQIRFLAQSTAKTVAAESSACVTSRVAATTSTQASKTLLAIEGQGIQISSNTIAKETIKLNRETIKFYLNNIGNLNRRQILNDLKAIGLQLKGKSPDMRFIELIDKRGILRVKIHPADKITKYDHIHIYNRSGNSLSKNLKVVNAKSEEAHIQINSVLGE